MENDQILNAFVESYSKKKPTLLAQQGGAKVKIVKKKDGKKTFRK